MDAVAVALRGQHTATEAGLGLVEPQENTHRLSRLCGRRE